MVQFPRKSCKPKWLIATLATVHQAKAFEDSIPYRDWLDNQFNT